MWTTINSFIPTKESIMPVNVKTTATKPEGTQWFRVYKLGNQEFENLPDIDTWIMSLPGVVSFKKSEISNLVTEEVIVFQDTEAFINYQKQRETSATFTARRDYNTANNIRYVVEVSVS